MNSSPFYVYILQCADNSLQVGLAEWGSDLLAIHNGRKPGPHLCGGQTAHLAYLDGPLPRPAAVSRELLLKGLSDAEKRSYIHRSNCRCERLRKELRAMGGYFGDGHLGPEVGTTERQLREARSFLKWEAQTHAREAEVMGN